MMGSQHRAWHWHEAALQPVAHLAQWRPGKARQSCAPTTRSTCVRLTRQRGGRGVVSSTSGGGGGGGKAARGSFSA